MVPVTHSQSAWGGTPSGAGGEKGDRARSEVLTRVLKGLHLPPALLWMPNASQNQLVEQYFGNWRDFYFERYLPSTDYLKLFFSEITSSYEFHMSFNTIKCVSSHRNPLSHFSALLSFCSSAILPYEKREGHCWFTLPSPLPMHSLKPDCCILFISSPT